MTPELSCSFPAETATEWSDESFIGIELQGFFRNHVSALISNISITFIQISNDFLNRLSPIYESFICDTLKVYSSTLGAANDHSDFHTAVIASEL